MRVAGARSVRPRGGIVGGPQLIAWQFILLTVIHSARSKGFPSPDITTSSALSTLATTEEGEDGEDDVSEAHDTDSGDKSDDEALVLVSCQVEVAIHIAAVADGVGSVGAGGCGVSVGGRVGTGWDRDGGVGGCVG